MPKNEILGAPQRVSNVFKKPKKIPEFSDDANQIIGQVSAYKFNRPKELSDGTYIINPINIKARESSKKTDSIYEDAT